jgi:hypothetical protein
MSFWKKSEDPWDWEPERRHDPVPEQRPLPDGGGVLDALRDFGRKAKTAAVGELESGTPAEKCPWCGKEMARWYLASGRDPIRCSWKRPGVIGMDWSELPRLDDEGGFLNRYKTVWHCGACKKMVMDAPEVQAENSRTDEPPKEEKLD